ncbi:4Fe-4S dicluster domain-containing protein [Desulfolutivibrio sulfoxidireducens]|uniref:4Fe-4S dicluster domain-containing protein n=1 Tax=Desulfolutivibrio sulfoxidireducens TaxID=2773299 RepID=UPI00159CFE04|nr:4Fe-4S dicluster domain-containing protein [Desulfolutivibrio sulfoxidireducens]QLA15707.1 4Fe-4S ferredoxin [Desulfolutivibrio sulfoxidireducens]QLA19312.1 4Fe-4S ferredoxin [Desulfolutivibrio sulfoxidireducens]
MKARAKKIREIARRLLAEGKVDVVVGYARGTSPMREQPFFARTPEEADQLTWSSFCVGNTANSLPQIARAGERAAVVAQGCASRNVVGLIVEKQVRRDKVYVIGVPCLGMIDARKVEALIARSEGRRVEAVEEDGEDLVVRGRDFEKRLKRKELLRDNCYTCRHRNPVLADELAAEPVAETGGGDIDASAAPWEKFSPADRWARFRETFQDCIRCYACRDACPLCYCTTCFVDDSRPQWLGKTQDMTDVTSFHLLRAFHCAGRCTDCGACESACPQGIKVRRLTSKIEKDIRTLYNYEAGMDPEAVPPMTTFKADDSDDFIKQGGES